MWRLTVFTLLGLRAIHRRRRLLDLFEIRDAIHNGRCIRSNSRQLMLKQTCRVMMLFITFSCLRRIKNSKRRPVERRFREAVDACQSFARPLDVSDNAPYAIQILEALRSIDHVFILSLDTCETKLPKSFAGRATCIVGAKLDASLPTSLFEAPIRMP